MKQRKKYHFEAALLDIRVLDPDSPEGKAALAEWDEEYQDLKRIADWKRKQGIPPDQPYVSPDPPVPSLPTVNPFFLGP